MPKLQLQDWPDESHHLAYTLVCFTIQYLIPCLLVGSIYIRVCCAFTARLSMAGMNTNKNNRKLARRKKTNLMLILVSLVFFLSWAPINIYNLVLDIGHPFKVISKVLTEPQPLHRAGPALPL